MSTPNTDLWDKVLTLRCADCGRVERDIYAALVRESRFKEPPELYTHHLCPRCVHNPPEITRYPRSYPSGSWHLSLTPHRAAPCGPLPSAKHTRVAVYP